MAALGTRPLPATITGDDTRYELAPSWGQSFFWILAAGGFFWVARIPELRWPVRSSILRTHLRVHHRACPTMHAALPLRRLIAKSPLSIRLMPKRRCRTGASFDWNATLSGQPSRPAVASPSGSSALTSTAACVRLTHSSFLRMAVTCTFTVFSARPSS